jgi:hypothetical protein
VGSCIAGRVRAVVVFARFGGHQQLVDACGQRSDLRVKGVDLIQQHPRQFGMVVIKAPVEGLDQRRALDRHPAAGQIRETPWITLAGDQRLDHVARRERIEGGRHRRQLDQGIFKQFLQPLPVPGAFPGQIHPQPGVVA